MHNGQITNYWKMRRRLEKRSFEFGTDNDSELIAVYLADKLAQGIPLEDALRTSIEDLDGTFSFLVSTEDEIGYAKDRLAAKPMVMVENDELVAIASEEVSLNRLFPGKSLTDVRARSRHIPHWRRSGLCRCGNSSSKPLCDGTHRRSVFRGSPHRGGDAVEALPWHGGSRSTTTAGSARMPVCAPISCPRSSSARSRGSIPHGA